jgi:hypothetical protein
MQTVEIVRLLCRVSGRKADRNTGRNKRFENPRADFPILPELGVVCTNPILSTHCNLFLRH